MTDTQRFTVNQKNAEKYLLKIRAFDKNITSKQQELEALCYKASGAGAIRYDKDRVQTSSNNFMEMAMCDIVELSAEIEEDKSELDVLKGTAYAIVRKMKNHEQRALIEWFYLNCVNMQEISERMHLSERNAYYLRDDALESFGLILKNLK